MSGKLDNSRARVQRWIVIGAIFLSLAYLPSLLWLAYRLGATEVIVADVKIVMKDGWFPVAQSGSWFGNLISPNLAKATLPTVVLCRVSGWKPGWDQMAAIAKNPNLDESKLTNNDASLRTQDYAWGKAYFIRPETSGNIQAHIIVVPRFGITISSPDETLLNDIADITLISKR